MDVQLLSKLLASLSLLLICTQVVDGFATTHCENDQLGGQITGLLQCSLNNFDKHADEGILTIERIIEQNMNQMSENPTNNTLDEKNLRTDYCALTQKAIKEEILCGNSFTETCFGEQISGLVSEVAVQISLCGEDLQDYAKSKFTFDKTCTFEERGQEMFAGPISCFQRETASNEASFGNFETMKPGDFLARFGMNSSEDDNQNTGMMVPAPKCTTIVEMLNSCFGVNRCFSQEEMDLLRDMALTIYHMGMEHLTKNLPRFKGILESIAPPEVLEKLTELVTDYETAGCKSKIESSPAKMLSAELRATGTTLKAELVATGTTLKAELVATGTTLKITQNQNNTANSAPSQLLSKFLAMMLSVFFIMMI